MKTLFTSLVLSLGLVAIQCAHAQAVAPAGSTGQCKDGTYTSNATKKGACRGHKGVKEWYANSAAPAAAATPAANTREKQADAAAAAPSGPAPAGSTGLCKDGTYTSNANKKGACRGHKGVKDWYANSTAPAALAPAATTAPAPTPPRPAQTAAPGGGAGQVWVNAETKVYHCQGDRWYGKTKQGSYMTEAAAIAAGYHAARSKSCSAQ